MIILISIILGCFKNSIASTLIQKTEDKDLELQAACMMGNKERMKQLIEEGANVNAPSVLGFNILFHSIVKNQEIAELLIKAGADVNRFDDNHRTCLHCASAVGNRGIVELLLQKGANVNALDVGNRTPLFYACLQDH